MKIPAVQAKIRKCEGTPSHINFRTGWLDPVLYRGVAENAYNSSLQMSRFLCAG